MAKTLADEKEALSLIDKYMDLPTVQEALEAHVLKAVGVLRDCMSSMNENVKLAAARDLLDRAGYKPVERKDITSGGQPIAQAELSDEKLIQIIDGFLKRTSIPAPSRDVTERKD